MVAMTPQEYRDYLDEDILAFIDETNSWYPPDTVTQSIEQQRATYDAMCRAFFQGYPDGVTAKDVMAVGVPTRIYGTPRPVTVIYMHGGGYVVGGLESHDDVCADICAATGLGVISVDYRLLPEHCRADALDDCRAALNWARGKFGGRFILAGDSAGAYLASTTALCEHGPGDLAGVVLIYGGYGDLANEGSMQRHANAPLLSAEEVLFYDQVLRETDAKFGRIISAPTQQDFAALPPVFAAAAECDPIASRSEMFVAEVQVAGGKAELVIDKGLVHGHLRARHRARKASESFHRILAAIIRMSQ